MLWQCEDHGDWHSMTTITSLEQHWPQVKWAWSTSGGMGVANQWKESSNDFHHIHAGGLPPQRTLYELLNGFATNPLTQLFDRPHMPAGYG